MRVLLFAAAVIGLAIAADRGSLGPLSGAASLLWMARAVFAAAFLLAWRFHRGRLAAAALLLTAVAETQTATAGQSGEALWLLSAFLLPLNLMLLSLIGEWRVLSRRGFLRFAALGCQGLVVLALHRGQAPRLVEWLEQARFDALSTGAMPQSVAMAFALAAVTLLIRLALHRTPFEAGLLGALAAAFLALDLATRPLVFLIAAGMALVISQVENAFSLAFVDALTGLPARRALEENLRHLGRRYAIAMVDIDHFKRLNDRHGHEVGDQVLRLIASRLAKVGGGGTAYRYGGEEFTILFLGASASAVESHLQALGRSVAEAPFTVRGPASPKTAKARSRSRRGRGNSRRQLKVTVSIGCADRNARRRTAAEVLAAADRALYRAKRAGRNRVVISAAGG